MSGVVQSLTTKRPTATTTLNTQSRQCVTRHFAQPYNGILTEERNECFMMLSSIVPWVLPKCSPRAQAFRDCTRVETDELTGPLLLPEHVASPELNCSDIDKGINEHSDHKILAPVFVAQLEYPVIGSSSRWDNWRR